MNEFIDLGTKIPSRPEHVLKLMKFIDRMRLCVFIMAIALTKMSLMVVYTVNAFIVFSSFTCSTNHTCSKMKMNLYFFYLTITLVLHFASLKYFISKIYITLWIKLFGKSLIDIY